MFYEPGVSASGLPWNPFKACCVPRPIGWLSTVDAQGRHNLAPYSQFQNLTWDPPMVLVAANCRPDGSPKDTAANILATGEFVWNMATFALRDDVLRSSTEDAPGVDEFEKYGIAWLASRHVAPRRVARSPVHFECRLRERLFVPGNTPAAGTPLLIGEVIGVHIDDAALRDGKLDMLALQPLARLGYRDYTRVTEVFELDVAGLSGRPPEAIEFLKERSGRSAPPDDAAPAAPSRGDAR
jgi:flavin reductase (DIM6/NTAB) family NADH-FMN oxidoreductase RutF